MSILLTICIMTYSPGNLLHLVWWQFEFNGYFRGPMIREAFYIILNVWFRNSDAGGCSKNCFDVLFILTDKESSNPPRSRMFSDYRREGGKYLISLLLLTLVNSVNDDIDLFSFWQRFKDCLQKTIAQLQGPERWFPTVQGLLIEKWTK